MGEGDVELVRRIYGFDWVGVGSRRAGFGELSGLVSAGFQSRLSPELGERLVEGVEGLAEFSQAVEQDFSKSATRPTNSSRQPAAAWSCSARSARQGASAGCH